MKAGYVDPDSMAGEIHALSVCEQPTLCAGLTQRRESSTQGGAGAALTVFWPEQAGERVPGVALFRHRQVSGEGYRLARVDLDRHTVMLNARRTQQ
jgi:hypothetical protein